MSATADSEVKAVVAVGDLPVGILRFEMNGIIVHIAQFSPNIEMELREGRPYHVWNAMIRELANAIIGSKEDIKYNFLVWLTNPLHCLKLD